jgi:hypothetical protein
MFHSLADRGDTSIVTTLSVGNRHDLIFQPAEGEKSPFPICLASVFRAERKAAKNLHSIGKIDTGFWVGTPFRFIPGEPARL